MITKVQKWGNGQGVRLSKAVLANLAIEVGDEIEVVLHRRKLLVSPARRVRGRHDLRALVRQIPQGYKSTELDW